MPTIIDELAMTLKLDPAEFEEGMEKAETASESFLQRIISVLQKIEQKTEESAGKTANIHAEAAEKAKESADKGAEAQGEAARRGAHEVEEAAKRAAEASKKHAEEMHEAFKKAGESVKEVAEHLLELFGIAMSVEAMKRLFEGISESNEAAGNLAHSIGLSVEALTTLQNLAPRVGGTAEGVAEAMKTLSNEAQAWHYTGRSNLPSQARELFHGLNVIGKNNEMMQGPELLQALADQKDRFNMSPEQVTYALGQMHLSGIAPQVIAGGDVLRREKAFQKESGNFATDEDVKQALEFSEALNKVQQNAMGVARVFWRELGPGLTEMIDKINLWIGKNREWLTEKATEWAKALGEAISALAEDFGKLINGDSDEFVTTIGEVAHVVKEAADAVGGFTPILEFFFGMWAAGKVAGIITGIASVTEAVTGLGIAATLASGPIGIILRLGALMGGMVGLAQANNRAAANNVNKEASKQGYTVNNADSWFADPTYTKDGKTIDYAEMRRIQGISDPAQSGIPEDKRAKKEGAAKEGASGNDDRSSAGSEEPTKPEPTEPSAPAKEGASGWHFSPEGGWRKWWNQSTGQRDSAGAGPDEKAAWGSAARVGTGNQFAGPGAPADVGNPIADNSAFGNFLALEFARSEGGGGGGGGGGGSGRVYGGMGRGHGGGPRLPAGGDPDAGATGTDLAAGLNASQEHVNAFRAVLGQRESGGRYGIMGGSSGRFAGKYQMGAAEIAETAKRLNVPVPSQEEFLHNPAMQEKFFANYTLDHDRQLMRDPAYRALSPDEKLAYLATAHLKGVGGATKQLHGGSAGVDAFGTSGASYAEMIRRELAKQPSQVAAAPSLPPRPPLVASPAAVAAMTPAPAAPVQMAMAGGGGWDNAPPPAGAATTAQGFQTSSSSSIDRSQSSQTHIGDMHIHTAATDAAGIAGSIKGELKRFDYVAQSDTGLA